MTAVAEIGQKVLTVGGEKGSRAVRQEVWTITWRGPCGAASSGTWYRSRERAVAMAKECGATELSFAEAHLEGEPQ